MSDVELYCREIHADGDTVTVGAGRIGDCSYEPGMEPYVTMASGRVDALMCILMPVSIPLADLPQFKRDLIAALDEAEGAARREAEALGQPIGTTTETEAAP